VLGRPIAALTSSRPAAALAKEEALRRRLASCCFGQGMGYFPPLRPYEEVADFIAQRGPREVAEFKPSVVPSRKLE
jgi:hypothetical protein